MKKIVVEIKPKLLQLRPKRLQMELDHFAFGSALSPMTPYLKDFEEVEIKMKSFSTTKHQKQQNNDNMRNSEKNNKKGRKK